MTGRELIIYILQNNLLDEPIIKDNKIIGFMSDDELAVKLDVGIWTVRTWITQGTLPGVQIGEKYFIPANIY